MSDPPLSRGILSTMPGRTPSQQIQAEAQAVEEGGYHSASALVAGTAPVLLVVAANRTALQDFKVRTGDRAQLHKDRRRSFRMLSIRVLLMREGCRQAPHVSACDIV